MRKVFSNRDATRGGCPGLIQQPGSSISFSNSDLDKAVVSWKCQIGKSYNLAPDLGDRHTCFDLYCTNISVNSGDDFDTLTATYEGFISSPKIPVGGAGSSTTESSIQFHPNYTDKKESWGVIIGDGNASPNAFGRLLDEDGLFKTFGPLPSGEDGPDPHERNVDCVNKVTDLCRLMGTESFLDQGGVSYKYRIVTENNWAEELTEDITKKMTPKSDLIPVPSLPGGDKERRDWLLMAVNIEPKPLRSGKFAYYTEIEFKSSGAGGWNALIYQDAGSVSLDQKSGAKQAFSGL
jgi:hypothetical protein